MRSNATIVLGRLLPVALSAAAVFATPSFAHAAQPDPRFERRAAEVVARTLPAPLDRRQLDEVLAAAASERGVDAALLVPEAPRADAIAIVDAAVANWSSQGLPELRMAIAAELRASGIGALTAKGLERLLQATDRIAAFDAAGFTHLREACGEAAVPLIDRAAALRGDRFWRGGMTLNGGFGSSDLEAILASCDPGAPVPDAAEPLLRDYRRDRLALLREVRGAFYRGLVESPRVALDAQAWIAARMRAAEADPTLPTPDPMVVMGLAMLAQMQPVFSPLDRLSELQQRTLDAILPAFSPETAWCTLASIAVEGSAADPEVAAQARGAMAQARRLTVEIGSGDRDRSEALAAWRREDAALLRRWMRLLTQETATTAAVCRTALGRDPIDFEILAAEVDRLNDPGHPMPSVLLLRERHERAKTALAAIRDSAAAAR